MNESSLIILLGSALSIGFIHTVIGPDHYVPFIMIGRARKWSVSRAMAVTFACGLGHVISSVAIGAVGILIGSAAGNLRSVENVRGEIASYALIIFGLAYGIWGIWRGRKGHNHIHLPGGKHIDSSSARSITFWALFIIFVLGPCEPLIPILMFPAVSHNWHGVLLVTAVFGMTTLITMLTIVYLGIRGLAAVNTDFLEKYVHVLAGAIIAVSGMAIRFFGI